VRAQVICLASAKGGSGKTMLTASLATFVGTLGRRVLMIDTDAATNGLTLLYLTQVVAFIDGLDSEPSGLFDDDLPLAQAVVVPLDENIDLLPATFVGKNTEDVPIDLFRSRLELVVDRAREDYDLILLDAQAGADEYARVALSPTVSDQAIIVSEYDPMSAAGVERLKVLLGESLSYARTWIVLNKVLPEFAKSFGEFLEIARYAPPIPWDADVVRAYARRTLALDLEFGNEHTVAIIRVLRTVLSAEMGSALDKWEKDKTDVLRQPITVTAARLREQFESAEKERQGARRALDIRQYAFTFVATFLFAAGSVGLSLFGRTLPAGQTIAIMASLAGVLGGLFAVVRVSLSRIRDDMSVLEDRRSVLRERLTAYENVADLSLDNLVTIRTSHGPGNSSNSLG
jgi:cellulose biosynthesis protein BcsQ